MANADAEQPRPEPSQATSIQIQPHWSGVQGVRGVLANQLAAQVVQGNVILTFGQAMPPLVSGTPEEAAALVQEEGVKIEPLARFVIPFEVFHLIVASMLQTQDQVKQHESGGVSSSDAQTQGALDGPESDSP